jgi:hypothetical protein
VGIEGARELDREREPGDWDGNAEQSAIEESVRVRAGPGVVNGLAVGRDVSVHGALGVQLGKVDVIVGNGQLKDDAEPGVELTLGEAVQLLVRL